MSLPLVVSQSLGVGMAFLSLHNLTRSQWILESQIRFSISQQESFAVVRLEMNAVNLMCCLASAQLIVEIMLGNEQVLEVSTI
jgi:hypothetical protein